MAGNILVTCATGGLGILTFDFLLSQTPPPDPRTLFALTRDPRKPGALALAKKGVTIRTADFYDPKTLPSAMGGIQTLMFISSGTMGDRTQQHYNVINAAKNVGSIKHIVYTSILRCSKNSKYILTQDHVATEEALKNSGIPYTIFRNTYYMDVLPFMLGDAIVSGRWCYPVGDSKINFASKPDIAEGLAKVLMNLDQHLNQIYEIVGGKACGFAEIAPIICSVTGKSFTYDPVTMSSFKVSLKTYGMVERDVKCFASSAEAIANGQFDLEDDSLENIIGHKTKTLEEYLPIVFRK